MTTIQCEKPAEPRTAEQERLSDGLGHAEPLTEPLTPGGSDHGGSTGIPPEMPPTDRDRHGGRPNRPPLWQRILLLAAVMVLLGVFNAMVLRKITSQEAWGA